MLVLVAGLLGGAGLFATVHAQESEKERAQRAVLEGMHLFRRILHDKGCESLGSFRELAETSPEQCILIVLGDADQIRNVADKLSDFVRKGGAALVASDRRMSGEYAGQLRDASGVTILGQTLTCAKENSFFRQPFCPLIVPVRDGGLPLFGETYDYKVATNLPSMLVPRRLADGSILLPGDVRPIAFLPSGCKFSGSSNVLGGEPLFAVGGDLGEGRILVLADHSIFINEMMLPTDNQNVEFTEACVDWLRGPNGQRKHVLFVENNTIQKQFDIPLKNINIPIEQAARAIFERRNELLVEAERGLFEAESNDVFNRGLIGLLDQIGLPPYRWFGLLFSFGALALLIWCIGRGIRRRFRHDTSAPILALAVGRNLPVEPVLEQRHGALLKQDNLWEPAAMLARRWFVRVGVERTDGPAPSFEASGSWWQRRKIVGRLRRLWRLACGAEPQRVTAPELWRLQRELDELRAEWERGGWRVVGAG
jgi:hypothetical protein